MADPLVAFARELEQEDASLAASIAEVEELAREADATGRRAADVEAFVERLPAERELAAVALAEAGEDVAAKRAEAERAEAQLERAEAGRKEEPVLAARRAVVRTRDAAAMAARKLESTRGLAESLERGAAAAEREAPELERRAAALAERLGGVPRVSPPGPPAGGLRGAVEWASRARAALLVVRAGLETERERVIRQANELAAGALGEPLFGANVTLVRERLEGRAPSGDAA